MSNLDPNAEAQTIERTERLKGLGVSRGVGKGNVVFLPTPAKLFPTDRLDEESVEIEIQRFRSAVETAKRQLLQLSQETDKKEDHQVAEIFSVQSLILESGFAADVESLIRDKKLSAEIAINEVLGEVSAKQGELRDDSFREKYLDIDDVATRLKRAIRGIRTPVELAPNAVVVARELRPSAVIELSRFNPAGLITEIGGWTSHMSIVAREFRLPMVTGIKDPEKFLSPGEMVIVDGNTGEVFIDHRLHIPEKSIITATRTSPEDGGSRDSIKTTDDIEFVIKANAEDPEAYRLAEQMGARGIGLYRSELLLPADGTLPDEESQTRAYSVIARAVGEFGVCIRTFDISPGQSGEEVVPRNPALGLRAIRSALALPESFATQIRAILRASTDGKIDIILPMVSNMEEVRTAKSLITRVRNEMDDKIRPVRAPRIGVMIEVPSAVLTAAQIADHVDFFCLGTNDLVQYLLAVDRDDDAVADWYQTLNPAVISAIRMVLDASAASGIPTIVCGEMAGSLFYLPVLVGLGAREFSVNPNSIDPIRRLLSGISAADATELISGLDKCETATEIEAQLRQYYQEHWNDLIPAELLAARHH